MNEILKLKFAGMGENHFTEFGRRIRYEMNMLKIGL